MDGKNKMTTPQQKLAEIEETEDPTCGFSHDGSMRYRDAKWLIARVKQLEKAIKKINDYECVDCTSEVEKALTTHPTETE